jgi:hypothetical protein
MRKYGCSRSIYPVFFITLKHIIIKIKMFAFNRYDVQNLIDNGEQEIDYKIQPDILTRFQLYFTGNALKGIELFNIGPVEMKGLAFMHPYKDLIIFAKDQGYKVFFFKEKSTQGWYLKFVRIEL